MNDNPLLLIAQRARKEAEQRRIMERAPAEAAPLEKVGIGDPSRTWRPGQAASHPRRDEAGVRDHADRSARAFPAEGIHA